MVHILIYEVVYLDRVFSREINLYMWVFHDNTGLEAIEKLEFEVGILDKLDEVGV